MLDDVRSKPRFGFFWSIGWAVLGVFEDW